MLKTLPGLGALVSSLVVATGCGGTDGSAAATPEPVGAKGQPAVTDCWSATIPAGFSVVDSEPEDCNLTVRRDGADEAQIEFYSENVLQVYGSLDDFYEGREGAGSGTYVNGYEPTKSTEIVDGTPAYLVHVTSPEQAGDIATWYLFGPRAHTNSDGVTSRTLSIRVSVPEAQDGEGVKLGREILRDFHWN